MSDRRAVPAVHRLLEHPSVAPYEDLVGRDALREAIASELDRVRAAPEAVPFEAIVADVVARVDALAAASLRGVINATGTLLHTNLGRAPIAAAAFDRAREIATGYSNLEFDLTAGERGSRYGHASDLLRELTGAADALVVNNCAAAVLLVLDTFARGAEVIVARSELVEIGGGFRIPDVLARSGARLVEVGTTNKTYLRDYERALSPRTALLMRSHRSNFSIEGFVHDVEPAELAQLGRRAGVAAVEDLGSGALVDLREYGLPAERTVPQAVEDGFALVAFSGDKLLGGPQAGIIVGSASHVARLRANPLLRALRVDKVTLALLGATLESYRTREQREQLPFYRMLAEPLDVLRARARSVAQGLPAIEIEATQARVGGGSLPQAALPSIALSVSTVAPDGLAARLRHGAAPVIGRIEGARVLLDLRTVAPGEDATVRETLARLLS